ncbi:DEAD/DEAH box helicase family protein [Listeria seeligeri]|nr:DEAD/DEAH box helicase family protein [Listeria seeligeri]MBC1775460.1 DEAD/DEAH box helicase family protein [Listeria seeligeri]MBC1827984.1 DEAD/DEAH box helicase family protein [Listeria seeligeri]MBC1916859.1 DEAD/DEAH box helicase family protein [Listeria seeligeri]MBC1990444.1 DEAD/DEAH box helicase family protein [Listeria seeligeri]
MSLRKPQTKSLEILDDITKDVKLVNRNNDLINSLTDIKSKYPTCTDFEKDFISLTFALATGVGKTRLMGAFISYLYTQHDIKNFFVVAPSSTIYEKLKKDLGDPSHSKYVFKGLGCFINPPKIISGEDYRNRNLSLFESDINIFIYNIDKFNKENVKMKSFNEYLGQSFYDELSNLNDLVMIMDESHHYRAEKGALALNELKPILGLELTATPLAKKGTKQVPFKNVVYEYPLSKAIEDGYTRTPFAVTRSDINFYNFGDEQIDKLMLLDGITCHENVKNKLEVYANNNNKRRVKPFMLVVCKNTEHATITENFIKSDEFKNGEYKYKTITVHSKMRGSESEQNMRLLLDVEDINNPIEIVIHVNMLKEGWDVNNLFTIVPLRTATSKILREQMVGRGLRLPYGERTGDKEIDAVMLTAHDKFNEILSEAQKGDSIFKAGNVIKVEEIEEEKIIYTQLTLDTNKDEQLERAFQYTNMDRTTENTAIFTKTNNGIKDVVSDRIYNTKHTGEPLDELDKKTIASSIKNQLKEDADLSTTYYDNEDIFSPWIVKEIEETYRAMVNKFIPIPRIKITDDGVEEYCFVDFNIDLTDFKHIPIENDMLIQSLENLSDRERIKGNRLDFEGYNPKRVVLEELRKKPEIDYEKNTALIIKLISQVIDFYEVNYDKNGMQNIVMMNRKDISNKIYMQMMQHFYCENGFLVEEVVDVSNYNLQQAYTCSERKNLYDNYTEGIRSILFTGIKKGVFDSVKFDSKPELILARILERDSFVKNWLRPAKQEFKITYNNGKQYVPDFVVETDSKIYLVEVKGEDKLYEPDVIAKKKRAIKYCEVVSIWGKANSYKKWEYLFIPSMKIQENSSFEQLSKQFVEE